MFKKVLSLMLTVIMALGVFAATVNASENAVSLRIEGIESCLYYGDITVNDGDSVYDVLLKADAADDSLTVVASSSQYGAYVTSINGITAGSQTAMKWDGWMFLVDGVSPSVGMDAFTVSGGEAIVIYYGDPYNTGMQYPIVNFDAETGTFTLTSLDTVYDENWNATTEECPVSGYSLIWEVSDGETVTVTADENGVAVIPEEYLTYGAHKVQYEKTAANGLPLILRAAPDFSVEIPDNRSFFEKIIDAIVDFFNMIINFFKTIFA